MAKQAGIDPKKFRAALRDAKLGWHIHGHPWIVTVNSQEHADLVDVLESLLRSKSRSSRASSSNSEAAGLKRASSDESWVIDQCDALLGRIARRQYRFPFLTGDPGKSGQRTLLPVDAYYEELRLVVEFHERQHVEEVRFFDRRLTISGVSRGEQRRIYDARRRQLLPENGIKLIEIPISAFAATSNKKLRRTTEDILVIKKFLDKFIAG